MRMRLAKLLMALLLVAANDYAAEGNNFTVGEDGVIGPKCLHLKNFYNSPTRYVQLFGTIRNVSVQFGRHATSRAKAALLMAGLRYRLGYRRVNMEAGYRSYCGLLANIQRFDYDDSVFDVLVVHTGAEWAGDDENCPAIKASKETALGLSPRMQIIDTGSPIEIRLHAHLTPDAWMDTECYGGAREWQFYTNKSVLQRCGFLHNLQPGLTWNLEDFKLPTINCTDDFPCVPLLFATKPGANNATVRRLLEYAAHVELRLRPVPVASDAALRRHLRNDTASFLFLDYDLWVSANTNETRVCTVQPPPCPNVTCPRALDTNTARFVGDIQMLAQSARMIYDALIRHTPHPTELREVLDLEADISNLEAGVLESEEAACDWAYNHRERFESWINMEESELWACVMVCKDDKDQEQYGKIIEIVGSLINETIKETRLLLFNIDWIDCHDPNALNEWLCDRKTRLEWTRMVGVIALGEGAAAAAAGFEHEQSQLVLYDVPGAVQLNDAAWTVGGRASPLASAITDFIIQQYWKRVAIISEDSSIAVNLTAALKESNKDITYEELKLKVGTMEEATNVLQTLDKRNARIFFANARASTAAMVLCEAARLGFTQSTRYAWIVREWQGSTDCEVEHIHPFTVSYWWRGGDESVLELGGNKPLRDAISQKMGHNITWPLMAAPMADGMLLLAQSVADRLRRFPWQRYDLHGGQNASRIVSESYTMNKPVLGVAQELRQHDYAQHQPLVFIHTWQGSESKLLQVLKVDEKGLVTNKTILRQAYDTGAAPNDGSISRCLTKTTGHKFTPQCHDVVFFFAGATILLMPVVLWLARRARINRLKRREQEIRMRLIARCERTATALAEHLVDRSALQIHEELGVGHFGCVRRGLLRLKQSRSKTVLICVAVKALRADAAAAEEAEFLREACALAALRHNHVVKLIGVCAADAPPLLLMEHAFNGDLLRYLRERRHLALINMANLNAENETNDIEAAHVSPTELTRLAREAADALDYLSQKRFVHRDVRAANCLLDQRRSLKLADFGLARNTGSASVNKESILTDPTSDDYAYICQRRGLFPVPWMAPESVARGVFSFMSDVWSLGVLVLEICTLGARPFGVWAAPRVLEHVRSGAHPPLPTDLDYNTREVLEMCWRLEPTSRYSAAAIKSHLTESPAAVRPAVRPAWIDQEADGSPAPDSGFGERDGDQWPRSDPHISTL